MAGQQNKSEKTVIDPVAMNITNRIAPGTRFEGTIECEGGLMVQGVFDGVATINGGPLVLMHGGVITGNVVCADAYLLGTIEEKKDGENSEITVLGTAFLAATLRANANVSARVLRKYQGAQVNGRTREIQSGG